MAANNLTLLTGAFPTVDPRGIPESVVEIPGAKIDAEVYIRASAGNGVGVAIGWDPSIKLWGEIESLTIASAVNGGVVMSRISPGTSYSHVAIWIRTAGATVSEAWIKTGGVRA